MILYKIEFSIYKKIIMERDNILFLQQFFGGERGKEIKQRKNEMIKNNPINIHSDCIIQISNLKEKNVELIKEVDNIKKEFNELSSKYSELSSNYKILNDQYKNGYNIENILSYEILIKNPMYKSLSDTNSALVTEIKDLKKNNEFLKLQLDDLLQWKNNHKCIFNPDDVEQELYDNIYNNVKDDIINEINIKDNPDYINLKSINDKLYTKVSELEEKLTKLDSNIDDNELFKKIKEQNVLLSENNKTLNIENEEIKKRLNILENNDNINIPDINIDSKINEEVEKQKQDILKNLENKYSSNISSLTESIKCLQQSIDIYKEEKEKSDKIINDLKEQINNKKIKNTNKSDKYSYESLYDSIYIYDDISLPYQKFRASKTYRKLLDEIEFGNKIDNISYEDIVDWINKNEKTTFKSKYVKNKYNRSKIILDKYKDDIFKIKNLKFSISYISNMSDSKFNEWLIILDDKFNTFYNKQ